MIDPAWRVQVEQKCIACRSRKYALDCYHVVVQDKMAEALSLASFFLKTGRPVILFVAGKQEIADTKAALQERGVPLADLEAVHGDMTAKEIHHHTRGGGARAYIWTNMGEMSLTIPGAVVIRTNEQRLIIYDGGVMEIHGTVFDFITRMANAGSTASDEKVASLAEQWDIL